MADSDQCTDFTQCNLQLGGEAQEGDKQDYSKQDYSESVARGRLEDNAGAERSHTVEEMDRCAATLLLKKRQAPDDEGKSADDSSIMFSLDDLQMSAEQHEDGFEASDEDKFELW